MDRKKSATIRIISWSVVAIALTAILVLGILGKLNFTGNSFVLFGSTGSYYANADKYKVGGGEISEKISDLRIDWLDGEVNVEAYDGNTVKISETSPRKLKEKEELRYYNDNGTLRIQYKASERRVFAFGNMNLHKTLTVLIPKASAENMRDLSVDTISGSAYITGIKASEIEMDSTSGKLALTQCSAESCSMSSTSGSVEGDQLQIEDTFNMDTVSGDARIKGSFGKIDYDSTSGELYADCENRPEKVETDSVSGDVTLVIPENEGFTYRKDTVSGSFQCDFELKQKEDKGTHKNGGASFSFDTVSGDISILRK